MGPNTRCSLTPLYFIMCSFSCRAQYSMLAHTFVFCYVQLFVWGPILDARSHLCILLRAAFRVGPNTRCSLTPLCFITCSFSCGDLYSLLAHIFVFYYVQLFVWGPILDARSHLCILLRAAFRVGPYTRCSLTPLYFIMCSFSCGAQYSMLAHTFVFYYVQLFVWGPILDVRSHLCILLRAAFRVGPYTRCSLTPLYFITCSFSCGALYSMLAHTFVFYYVQLFVWGPILDARSHLCVLLCTAVRVGTHSIYTFVFCYVQPFVWGPIVGAVFTPFLYGLLIYMEKDDSTASIDLPDTPPATQTELAVSPELTGESRDMPQRIM